MVFEMCDSTSAVNINMNNDPQQKFEISANMKLANLMKK